MTWTFTLPLDLPSANRHGGASTNARHAANAAMYRRQRGVYVSMLKAEMRSAGIVSCADLTPITNGLCRAVGLPAYVPPFRTVEIVRLWAKGCRAWDDDNMVASGKGLRDAMQRERMTARKGKVPTLVPGAGIVWDDSATWSRWSYGQERAADGRPGVRVTVSEASQGEIIAAAVRAGPRR